MAKSSRLAVVYCTPDWKMNMMASALSLTPKTSPDGAISLVVNIDEEDALLGLRVSSTREDKQNGIDMSTMKGLIPWRYIMGILDSPHFSPVNVQTYGFVDTKAKA
jgi:hypothetical protein